jgi:hypothetical protein
MKRIRSLIVASAVVTSSLAAGAVAVRITTTPAAATTAATATTRKTKGAPGAKEAFRLMLGNGDISLKPFRSCDSVKDPDDRTFADYVSTVLTKQTDPTITWYTAVTSKALDRAKKRWQVDIYWYGKSEGEPFDMGVRFVVDDATRKVDRASIACIGTS